MDDINAVAVTEKWQLSTLFENGTTKPLWEIRGLDGVPDAAARAFVYERARGRSAIHQQALRAVFESRAMPEAKKRKAR